MELGRELVAELGMELGALNLKRNLERNLELEIGYPQNEIENIILWDSIKLEFPRI